MRLFLNELSLDGQYAEIGDFISDLRELLDARARSPSLRQNLHCSSAIIDLRVTRIASFRQAIESTGDRDLKRLVLGWLGKAGPFWEGDRAAADVDVFHYADRNVTDQALGEAARRLLRGERAWSVGFPGSPHGCDDPELAVVHGPRQQPLATVAVANVVGGAGLERALLESRPPPASWDEMVRQARSDFDGLMLAEDVVASLRRHPFDRRAADHVVGLLAVVHQLVRSRDDDGRMTAASHDIVRRFFAGGGAWFSDESPSNKSAYKTEMTFRDPLAPDHRIFCPFHGKVTSNPPLRVHLAWPIESADRVARIVYIGPKITR